MRAGLQDQHHREARGSVHSANPPALVHVDVRLVRRRACGAVVRIFAGSGRLDVDGILDLFDAKGALEGERWPTREIGKGPAGVGLTPSAIGPRLSGVGVRPSGVGLRACRVGDRPSGVGGRARGVGHSQTLAEPPGHVAPRMSGVWYPLRLPAAMRRGLVSRGEPALLAGGARWVSRETFRGQRSSSGPRVRCSGAGQS